MRPHLKPESQLNASFQDKYSAGKYSQSLSISKGSLRSDRDRIDTSQMEELLSGAEDWRNIQDIIRASFRSLTDVVQTQVESIKDLEKQLAQKVSKTELVNSLSSKVDISELNHSVEGLLSSIEERPTFDAYQKMLRDYVHSADLRRMLEDKVSVTEMSNILNTRPAPTDFKDELRQLSHRQEELIADVRKKTSQFVSLRDFDELQRLVDQKIDQQELHQLLDEKISKQTLTQALKGKANKADFDSLVNYQTKTGEIERLQEALRQKADFVVIEELKRQLHAKTDRSELISVVTALETKADKREVDKIARESADNSRHALKEISAMIGKQSALEEDLIKVTEDIQFILIKKADSNEIERVLNEISRKSSNDKLESGKLENILADVTNEFSSDFQALKDEIASYRRKVDEAVTEVDKKADNYHIRLSGQFMSLNDQMKILLEEKRKEFETMSSLIKGVKISFKKDLGVIRNEVGESVERLKANFTELHRNRVEKQELQVIKEKLNEQLESKVDLSEVQNAINTCQQDTSSRFLELKDQMAHAIEELELQMFDVIKKKANSSEVSAMFTTKADDDIVRELVGKKTNYEEFSELKRVVETLVQEVVPSLEEGRGNQSDLGLYKKIEEIQKELLLKASIKDVCTLLDAKSNIEDFNKIVTDLQKQLDYKANLEELRTVVNDQALINESICTENIVGRWAWKSGELKTGAAVPWEIQLTNTLPDNFIWEKDSISILAVAPGLYEITLGFYSKKKPTLQVLVNGEQILTNSISASSTGTAKLKDSAFTKLSKGYKTGLTLVDFIILPPKAKVSIVYDGEAGGEGFIGLKRL